jgi:imidazolonepropionase-like amidohydrolase
LSPPPEICQRYGIPVAYGSDLLGELQPGAFSDVLVVDGNPLKDLALPGEQGKHLSLIMKAGILHKSRLN